MELDKRELAAVLAGLRLLQRHGLHAGGYMRKTVRLEEVFDVLTDCHSHVPLKWSEIDALCERLNAGQV